MAQRDGTNRFLALTDRLVSWMPSRFEELLERPVDPPRVPPAAAAQRVLRATLVASAVMVALLVVLHLVDQLVWGNSIDSLDADNDQSVWSWASVISESTAAVFLGLLAAVSTRRRALRFCAGVVLFLSLDDFIRIHERIVHIRRHLPGALGESLFPHAVRTLWPVIYLPLLAVLFVLLWRIAQGFATPERVAIRGSLLALVVAVALEVGTPLLFAIGQGDGSPGYEVEVAIEESLELAGWMWIAAGLAMGLLRSIGDDGRADATTSQPGLAQRPAGTQETGAGLPQDRGV